MVKSLGIGGLLLVVLLGTAALAQDIRPPESPEALDIPIDQLRFDALARAEGRLLILDTYDEAIWVQLTRYYDEGRWLPVQHEVQLLVYARDPDMMDFFRKMPQGTVLRMVIQYDENGKRRVLELEGT